VPEKQIERVLLTNDDGIDAPGLAVLEEVAATLAREVWVVAPEHDQSGTSHSISLHDPLRIRPKGERRFAVSGTPGDCVAMGVSYIMRDAPPQLVLSGVNAGANIGMETVFSGTVGAAMTAIMLGLPAIALSQAFRDRSAIPWDTARTLAPDVIRRLLAAGLDAQACLNVNFPAIEAGAAGPITMTRQGQGLLRGIDVVSGTDPRMVGYHWLRLMRGPRVDGPDADAGALAEGRISVTPLRFERTDDATHARIAAALG
jgi:5'-nucleotidase